MAKITISEDKADLPRQGELWWIKPHSADTKDLCLVALCEGGGLISFVVLESGNRFTSPMTPADFVNYMCGRGYALTKFTGTVTLSNGDDN